MRTNEMLVPTPLFQGVDTNNPHNFHIFTAQAVLSAKYGTDHQSFVTLLDGTRLDVKGDVLKALQHFSQTQMARFNAVGTFEPLTW